MATPKPTLNQEPSSEPQPKLQPPLPATAQVLAPANYAAAKPEPTTATAVAAAETPKSAPPETVANPRPLEPSPSSDASVAIVPSYARWFSFDDIHQCEIRFLPEFFDSRSPSKKSPRIYMYYRNSMVERYRADPRRKMTFTDARRTLVGGVGSIRRVFDFLEGWGLINYSPPASNKPIKWDDKETKPASGASISGESGGGSAKEERTKRVCNHCKSVCSIACFVCDKNNMTLCARCYVRGNYQLGDVNSSDFRRVEINEDSKTDWSDRDTLHLLEALMHYGDDWRKVARHVGRGEKECVSHFLKLPFGEEFAGFADSGDDAKYDSIKDYGNDESCSTLVTKRMCLTPLADASNPIMAQAAFLSALAGVDVAEAAARAAMSALSRADDNSVRESQGFQVQKTRKQETVASNGNTSLNAAEGAWADAKSQVEQEERDVERAISGIVEVQMKEIKDKIDRFEAVDLQMEKEWQQLEQMKNMLFVDQLTLLFHKSSAKKTGEQVEENVKTD